MFTVRANNYLLESNVVGVLPEALTAQVEAVLADQTVVVGARPAEKGKGGKTRGARFNTCISIVVCMLKETTNFLSIYKQFSTKNMIGSMGHL